MKHLTFVSTVSRIIIGLAILFGTNTFAADSRSLISGKFNATQKTERTEIAKDIKAKIELLDSYLPNLKPSEIAWIEEEKVAIQKLKGMDAQAARLVQLLESPEFQHQNLKDSLRNIKNNLDCIANEKVTLNSEMLCWAVTSHHLSEESTFDDSITVLKKHGRLPKDIAKKAGLLEISGYRSYSILYKSYARGIMEYIIIPYLAGNIK